MALFYMSRSSQCQFSGQVYLAFCQLNLLPDVGCLITLSQFLTSTNIVCFHVALKTFSKSDRRGQHSDTWV